MGHLILQDPQNGWQGVEEKMEIEREGGWKPIHGDEGFFI